MSKKHVSLGIKRQVGSPSVHSLTVPTRTQGPSLPSLHLQEDIERELTIAEMIAHSPPNPCECCKLSRDSTSRLWALTNMVITVYDTFDGCYGMYYFVKAMKAHRYLEVYGCKVQTNILTLILQIVDFLTALLYLGASFGFFLAVFHFDKDHKKTRLRLSKIYIYSCVGCMPIVGHFFLFVNNIRNCSRILHFDSVYIVSISVFIGTCVCGYIVAQSFVYLVKNPEIEVAEEDAFLRPGRRATVASHVSRSASHSSSLGRPNSRRSSMANNTQGKRRSTVSKLKGLADPVRSSSERRNTNTIAQMLEKANK